MQERVRLVGGTFLLESGPGKGTELQVLVPTKGEV
jgi:signal transduction histidine kinase